MKRAPHVEAGIGAEEDAGGVQEIDIGTRNTGGNGPMDGGGFPACYPTDDIVRQPGRVRAEPGRVTRAYVEAAEAVKQVDAATRAVTSGVSWSGT